MIAHATSSGQAAPRNPFRSIRQSVLERLTRYMLLRPRLQTRLVRRIKGDYFSLLSTLFPQNAPLTILDIGAHKGESVIKFKQLFPSATVHAFEPNQLLKPDLLQVQAQCSNVFLHEVCLSDQSGEATFYASAHAPTNSLLEPDIAKYELYGFKPDLLTELRETHHYTVQTTTLREWIAANSVKDVDILKSDTQGADYRVLSGGIDFVRNRVKVVVSELQFDSFYQGQALFYDICRLLYEHGFRLYDQFPVTYYQDRIPIETDAVFYNVALVQCGPGGEDARTAR